MTAHPQPPPEAALIRRHREAPPHMSKRRAAQLAGISEGRWRQLEDAGKQYRGRWEPEWAPAETLARMARAVGVTPDELTAAGRGDAASELAALPPQPAGEDDIRAQLRHMQEQMDEFGRLLREQRREPHDDKEDGNDESNGSRRAG